MSDRLATIALVAALSTALAAIGFAVTVFVDAFAPCRVPYRMLPAVQGSLACQSYAAITLFALLLGVAAGVLAAVAGIVLVVRRSKSSR